MIKAVLFDFGNTLYVNHFPPNWSRHYHHAIRLTLEQAGIEITPEHISNGETVLEKYNTRINPRDIEFDADTIFGEMVQSWNHEDTGLVQLAKDTFGQYFMGDTGPFPDTLPALKDLKHRGLKTGILSNVAYGLGKEYYLDAEDELHRYIDVFLTSVEAGYRKPHPAGLIETARRLETPPAECLYIGDEEVDVTASKAAEMTSILIDRDNTGTDYGQDHTINSLAQLPDLL